VTLSSLNIRIIVGSRLPPLTPHEPGGGGSAEPGVGGSVVGITVPPRISQHTCTPGHRHSSDILCTHSVGIYVNKLY
jgi:hypothetical protein